MKFTVKTTELKKVMDLATRIAMAKSTIPVLSCVKLWAENDILSITATDLDLTFSVSIECESEVSGKTVVNARDLARIVKFADTDELAFEMKEDSYIYDYGFRKKEFTPIRLFINADSTQWKLETFTVDQFPELPVWIWDKSSAKLPFSLWKDVMKRISFAITQERSRFTLSGAKMFFSKNLMRAVTTDGHRLAFSEIPIKLDFKKNDFIDALLPKQAIEFLNRLKGEEIQIGMNMEKTLWYFQVGGQCVTARVLNGTFPDYTKVIPESRDHTVNFELESLRRVLRRVSAVGVDDRSNRVDWAFNREGVSKLSNESCSSEMVVSGYTGDETVFGFNHDYLYDLPKIFPSGICKVSFDYAPNKQWQVVFEPKIEGGVYKYILMPLRG